MAVAETSTPRNYQELDLKKYGLIVVGENHTKKYPKQLIDKIIEEKLTGETKPRFCYLEMIMPRFQKIVDDWFDDRNGVTDHTINEVLHFGYTEAIESKLELMKYLKGQRIRPIGINVRAQSDGESAKDEKKGLPESEIRRIREGDLSFYYCMQAASGQEAPSGICLVGDAHIPGLVRYVERGGVSWELGLMK